MIGDDPERLRRGVENDVTCSALVEVSLDLAAQTRRDLAIQEIGELGADVITAKQGWASLDIRNSAFLERRSAPPALPAASVVLAAGAF